MDEIEQYLLDRIVEKNQRELEVFTMYHFVGLTKNTKVYKPVEKSNQGFEEKERYQQQF